MAKMKVISKDKIIEGLKNGLVLRYYDIYGKVYLSDGEKNIGAVRFDTFLDLRDSMGLKEGKFNYVYKQFSL